MTQVQSVFSNLKPADIVRYSDYWQGIAPQSEEEIFQRWLFAFTSIHTTWASNVRGYYAIRDFERWKDDKEQLRTILTDARVGMHNVRTEYIWGFSQDFWNHQQEFHRGKDETWADWRNRLVQRVKGIGVAKVSFALEMAYPTDCGVVCLDTHMLQLFGLNQSANYNNANLRPKYAEAEKVWLDHATDHEVPSYIARCLFWDTKQNQSDSRYWSYVFEQ